MHDTHDTPAGQPVTWTDWYRFACRTLELAPVEAAAYATARYVEQENRARLRERRHPGPPHTAS